jgi:hypothetical protein
MIRFYSSILGIRIFRWLAHDILQLTIMYPLRLILNLILSAIEVLIKLIHYISPMRASKSRYYKDICVSNNLIIRFYSITVEKHMEK